MVFTKKNEEAVSPVIGVILMVAITVILAAVIAAFVFGMAGNIQKSHTVAATVSRPDASDVIVTYQGGQDAATLIGVNFTVGGLAPTLVTPPAGCTLTSAKNGYFPTAPAVSIPVGASVNIPGAPTNSHIIVTGTFTDGTTQVILDTTL